HGRLFRGDVDIATEKPAVRLVVDGHGLAGLGNSGPFSIHAFMDDPEHTIIVYGTLDEESANRETALLLQHDLRQGNHTIVMPVRKDTEVTDDDMKECHVVVIGRPATNTVSAHFHDAWPVRFGLQSFEISRKVYAHAETSFIGAAENPLNPRYSMVLLAGLNSQGTFNGASGLLDDAGDGAQAAVMMRGSGELTLITVTPVELVRDLTVLK
ncbi:MAG: hypothetical protein WCN98_18245, partial [Verrucomicrobiaceae bacterium]